MLNTLFLLLWRSAPLAKKKETSSIFSSKSAFSEKSNDSGEYKLNVGVSHMFSKTGILNLWSLLMGKKCLRTTYPIKNKKRKWSG